MKKALSINLNGQLFTIEEDAYEQLQQYIHSINEYFLKYKEGHEIVKDIEARMAEKFFDASQKSPNKVLTVTEVSNLMATLGNVADFEADENDLESEPNKFTEKTPPNLTQALSFKGLYRITNQKILGGVAKGIAHKNVLDPFWIRMVFLLSIGLAPLTGGFSLVAILVYVYCWLTFPVKNDYVENTQVKKLYRKVEDKKIAGVATGLASYFGIDLNFVRLLLVASVFFVGFGIAFYLVVWLITPLAQTVTERMQMEGEPITLENISFNIEKEQNGNTIKVVKEEFKLEKVFSPLRWVVKKGGVFMRWFLGLLLLVIGASFIISMFIAAQAALGNLNSIPVHFFAEIPVNYYNDIPRNLILFTLFAFLAPSITIFLMGVSVVKKKNYFINRVGEVLLGVFLVSLIGASTAFSKYSQNFKAQNKTSNTIELGYSEKINTLDFTSDTENNQLQPKILFVQSDSSFLRLSKITSSCGKTSQEAKSFASNIKYELNESDSMLVLNDYFSIPKEDNFRNQAFQLRVELPKNKIFYIGEELYGKIYVVMPDGYEQNIYSWNNGNYVSKLLNTRSERFLKVFFNDSGELIEMAKEKEKKENVAVEKDFHLSNKVTVEPFTSLELNDFVTVEITDDSTSNQIEILTNVKASKAIKHNVKEKTLYLTGGEKMDHKVRLSVKNLENLALKGHSKVVFKKYNSQNMILKMADNTSVSGDAFVNSIRIQLTEQAEFTSKELGCEFLNLTASNNTKCEIVVQQSIMANLFDQAFLIYKGQPEKENIFKKENVTVVKKE
jgi:phage shock protein PspC (stress-responsive transcriptional regulator)